MNKANITKTKDCKTAEEFLNYLQIRHSRWLPKNEWTSPWIFRGQSDACWPLLPRTWRNSDEMKEMLQRFKTKYKMDKLTFEFFFDSYSNQIDKTTKPENFLDALHHTVAEIDIIYEFMETADRLGYPIVKLQDFKPWKDVMNRHFKMGLLSPNNRFPIWDGRDHFGVALAQHHGIPTSLMDWTRKPHVAALFAAEDVKENKSGYIAVWALNAAILDPPYNIGQRLQRLTIPQSELLYLHAQNSLFIYDKDADDYFIQNGRWQDIESILKEGAKLFKKSPLRKITLPAEKAGDVLRLLWAEGISKAQLMPTYDNITTALKSKWKWESKTS